MDQNIVLIGFMGSGKTTIGTQLSKKLDMTFVDMDHEIEKQAGKTIKDIFESEGESRFRAMETEFLEGRLKVSGCVLSTGGGVILKPENVALLAQIGTIVLLHADLEHIINNIKSDEARQNRPLLQEEDFVGKIKRLYDAREERYLNAADLIIQTSARRVEEITEEIISKVRDSDPINSPS